MSLHCLQCGSSLQGRSDKKFCGGHCRANYHNQKNRILYERIRHINAVLRHNHRILSAWKGLGVCAREDLIRTGFDFRYFTHIIDSPPTGIRYGCYDIGYELKGVKEVRIFSTEPPEIKMIIRKGGTSVLPREADIQNFTVENS
jgi:predicted nucleic acid-binding Zn ribbon protein